MRLWDGAQVRRKGKEGRRSSCHFTVQRRVTAELVLHIDNIILLVFVLAATKQPVQTVVIT